MFYWFVVTTLLRDANRLAATCVFLAVYIGATMILASDTFDSPHRRCAMPSLCYGVTSDTREDE